MSFSLWERIKNLFRPAGLSRRRNPTLYRKLLSQNLGDRQRVERLIALERKSMPYADENTLMRKAIERWERDNR